MYTNLQPVEQLVVQPVGGLTTTVEQPAASCKRTFSWLSNRLFNWFDNRLNVNRFDNLLNVCLHDAAGCSTAVVKAHKRLDNWIDNRLNVYIHDTAPVVQLVVKPVLQPAASCKQTFIRLFNWLKVCLHNAAGCSTGMTTG